LRLLNRSLPQNRQDPADLGGRLKSMQGAWMAGFGIMKVPYGASHGIGHSLGAVTGMSHGYTSCIMLPHVMRFNLGYTAGKQADIAEAMGRTDGDAAAAVAGLVAELGLPYRLRDLGVTTSQFEPIAQGALKNIFVTNNPRPITKTEDIIGLLEAAW
jgi:alcohol dehydrogenase class IV